MQTPNNRAEIISTFKPLLEECGYTGSRLKEDYFSESTTVALAGFATEPLDFDSACIAVMATDQDSKKAARACRGMGAPIVWVRRNGTVDWWVQHADEPKLFESTPVKQFPGLVRHHKDKLDPASVYRGKTIARMDRTRQLDFVDAGLLPLLRAEAGKKLHDLVEEMIRSILDVQSGTPGTKSLQAVFSAVFRLLAGKILKDKGIPGFKRLDLSDTWEVLNAVEKHYNAGGSRVPITGRLQASLTSAASLLAQAGSFAAVSPESLAYVYERTLVNKPLRKKLGIHATPPSLVDFMVWEIYDWIQDIPIQDRHVFEPACGHAPFLLSAMRVLRLENQEDDQARVHNYLKAHVHGMEIDSFAMEIARLSLTLADIPNSNGWDLQNEDMFAPDALKQAAINCRILLCNPPYESFSKDERRRYEKKNAPVSALTKGTEFLERTLPYLPPKSVFAVVVPLGVLYDKESKPLRERLLADFDLSSVNVFPDKLFEYSDHEVTVLTGRRRKPKAPSIPIRYRRVRDGEMKKFKEDLAFSWERDVQPSRFEKNPDTSMLLPDLLEIWDYLSDCTCLEEVADIQKGFEFLSEQELDGREVVSSKPRNGWPKAILKAADDYNIWELPNIVWADVSRKNLRRIGMTTSLGIPQVIVNYAPNARAPWRLKAAIDEEGIAVASRFVVFRPKLGGPSLRVLWALLNSPVANAYAYCISGKRETLVKQWRKFPFPYVSRERANAIDSAASRYLSAVTLSQPDSRDDDSQEDVKRALLSLDAEVLKLYDLPPRFERQLLELFTDIERKGVGCVFRGYYSPGFTSCLPLHMVLSERFQRAAADATADRFKPGESAYVSKVLSAAMSGAGEE